jgi:hypothetical protein
VLDGSKRQASHALRVVRATKQIELRLTWPRKAGSFDVTGLGIGGRRFAATEAAPVPLAISRRRTATSLVIRITQRPDKLRPGKLRPGALAGVLRFTVAGRALLGAVHAITRVRQLH